MESMFCWPEHHWPLPCFHFAPHSDHPHPSSHPFCRLLSSKLCCYLKINPSSRAVDGHRGDFLHRSNIWNGDHTISSGCDCRPFQFSNWNILAGGFGHSLPPDGKVFGGRGWKKRDSPYSMKRGQRVTGCEQQKDENKNFFL